MKPVRTLLFSVTALMLAWLPFPLCAQDKEIHAARKAPDLPITGIFSSKTAKVETVADSIEYLKETKKIVAKGNVVVQYEEVRLTADYAEVETETKKVYAKGHVIIFRGDSPIAKADEVHYDFATHSGSFPDGRIISFPWFIAAEDIQQIRRGVKVATNATLTTCDLDKPHFDIRARKVRIYDKDKMIATNIRLYVLDKPIFWWPYLVIPLQNVDRNLPFSVSVGRNSRYGYFIETTKGISITEKIWGKLHGDWRSKRGVGGGVDLNYDFGAPGRGLVRTYLTQDKRAPSPGARDPFASLERRERGRVTWLHRTNVDSQTNVILRYNRLADEFFLQEFFQKESRAEIEPQSFVTFTKNSEHHGFLTHVEKRMNRFESSVQKLPLVQFDWKNQPFFNPGLFYESQYSFANFSKVFGRSASNEDVVRFDGVNEWSAPLTWDHITATPFLNWRNTLYNRERHSSDGQYRVAFGGGLDLRTHFYKTFPASFDRLGIEVNQLRHLIEPYLQYRSVKSTVSDETLNQFDPIDRLDDADIVTFGIENRFQTKRVVQGRMQRVDFVSLNTFLSYEIHPDGRPLGTFFAPFEDGRTASNFTVLGEEIVLRPYQWLFYEARFDYDMERDQFRIANHDLKLQTHRFYVIFGNRFIRDFPSVTGSNQFVFDGKWTLNSLWSLGGYIRWDPKKDGLQEWQIAATRDLHDFMLDFGYNVRDSSIDSSNKTLFFDFRLKAFPIIGIHGGGNRSSFSPPRIGETVAGSNSSSSPRVEGY